MKQERPAMTRTTPNYLKHCVSMNEVLGRALAQSLDMTGVVPTMSVPSTGIVSKHFTTTHNLR